MIYNLNKNKSNPVENYHRKLAERKYARDKSLKTRDEEINAESDYIQNTPEFESYTPAYDVNQNITQNVAEKTEEETNKGGFWGGLGYAIEQLGLGLVRSLEGISDYVVGGVAELFGQDEWADEQMRNDWINYDHANEWYNPDGVMQFVGDVASGVGGMLPSIGAAAIPGIGPALSTGMFMTSAAGQSVSDAAKQNEGLSGNEWLYGTGSGLVEGLVEKMSGGTGKLLGKATGKMFGKQIAKSTAGKLAANFVGEGLEEVASDIIDPALRGITGVNSWEEVKRQYGDLPEQLPHTFLVGGTVGSVLGSADRAGRAIQAKGFNNLNAIENASEFKRVEGQNAQAAVKGGKVLDNTALREKLSDNLRKMDSAQRSEFISRNGLENYFNADGGIKSASENSIVSQGYNAQAYSENIANIDKDKLKYKPTANAIRPDIAQAVKDVTLLSDGNGRYVITDGLSDGVNGFYDRESGITYLSGKADAGDVRSYVASHELVHTLEGSRQYERFANTVLKEINSSEALKNKYNIDRYIQNYSAAHDGVAPETLQYIVQTEIVADFAAKEMLTDEAVLRRLINRDRNIVQRILDWVRDKIKILVSKGGDRSNIAFYKKAERQLAKALDNPTGGVSITAMDNAFKAKETSRKTAAENTLAVETGIRFSQKISEYPYSMQTVISEYIESVNKKILDMVEVPKSIFERYTFSEISPEAVVKLKELTGIDFTGYKNCINSDSIKHIKDRHGKAGKADDSLSNSKDIARLPYIVENFDTIELLKNGDGKLLYSSLFYNRYNKKMPLVVFKKKINGTYYCVEAVGDNSYKKLWVVSAYINKKGLTHASDTANAAPEFTSENAHISRPFDSIIRERAEKSTEKSKNIEKNSETKSNEVGEEARYSIVNINAGRKAVLIKDNILDGVSKKDRLKTVYDTMKKFSNGIPIAGGRLIKVNAITRNEYINSKNAQYLKGNITKNTIFIDKMKASGHLDEIVLASDSYVNEGLKHTRNDNIKEFARGNVLLDIAGNQYAANVIVGFTGSNMILYDVVDFKPTKFTVTEQNGKKIDAAEGANPFERATPSTTSIREKTEKSTEKSKNIEKNSELRYSLKPFAEQVDDVLAGKRSANLDLYVSETPDVFVKLGFPKTPMLMRNSKVKEILEKHMEMSVELIKQIPEAIQNPLFILKSKTNPNESVVAITEIVTDKGELIVPVWVNQDGVYLDIDLDKPVTVKTNFVASAYGRNVKGLLEYAADNGGILYVNSNKEKVGELLTRHGLQLPAPLRITDSTTSIREKTEKSTEKSKNIEKSIVKEKNAGEERFSIAQTDDGKRIVVIDTDQDIFNGVDRAYYGKTVRDYMRAHFRGKTVNDVKFTDRSEREYIMSQYSQKLRKQNNSQLFETKMKAATELDNLVATSEYMRHEDAKHIHGYNTEGYNRYHTTFELDGKMFTGELLVALKGDSGMFYDIVNIKETHSTSGAKTTSVERVLDDTKVLSTTSIREKAEKSTEKSKNIEKSIVKEKNAGEERFSIAQTDDGKRIVVIDTDQDIFDGVERSDMGKIVRSYMKERYRGRSINGTAFTAQSEREFTHSRDSQRLYNKNNGTYEAKMRVSTELSNIIQTGDLIDHETAKHPQTINEGGIKRYNVSFVLDGKTFNGEMIIAVDKKGVETFYDVIKIKESESSNNAPDGTVRTNAHSINIISNNSENVNSLREKGEKSDDVRYSLKPFAEQVDGALDRKLPKGDSVLVSEHTPEWIIKAGFDDLPMLITQKHLRDINTPEETVGKGNYHGISREKIKQLPIRLQNPVMLFDSLTDSRSIVVVTDMLDDKGRPVVVAVRADGSGMYLGIDIKSNFVTSFYGKDGFASFILKHINQENLLYWNKEKSRKLYDTIRVQFPQALTTYDSDIIIRMSEAKVNSFDKNNLDNRFSLKKIDSYTEKQYNDYGWVRANDVLSNREYSDFNSKLNNLTAEIRRNKTAAGEYIIPVNDMHSDRFGINNVLVFAKGTYQNPKITRIIRIKLDNETDIDLVRSKIYESKGIIGDSYWDGILEIYNAETFQRREQREGSRAGGGTDSQVQNGERGTGSAGETADLIYSLEKPTENVNSLREKGGDVRNSLKNEITTYGNGMSVTQKPGKYSEVLTKVKTDKLSYGEIAKDAWTNFQINFSDAQTGIVKAGKKLGIEDIDAKTNYVRAAYNAANSMLDENQADISGKRVGDGLKKIFSPVYKKGEEYVKEFYTYLLLKHHADRIKVDKTVLGDLTAAEALQLAVQREIKYPEFKTLAAKVWKYNDNLLQYRVDTGLITAEAAAACRKLYPHYVPTFREGGSSGIGGLSGKYNLAVKSTLKTAKGSTLDIMPIDVIMARQTMEVVRAGRINQLKNSLYDALESRQNYSDMRVAGVERVNKVTEKLRLTAPVKAELYNTLDVDYSTMRDMNNQISFYKDGNRITLDVTPEVFAGFEDFAPNTVYRDKLIEVVAKGNTMFKKLVTSANPFFLVRNFFRDLQDSLFYTKHGIRRFLPSLAKAYKQIATKGEMWNEYLAAGGLSSGLFDYNTGIKRDGTGLKSLAERALNKLEYANMFIEQAPRLAEYMLSRQKGLSVEQSLLDSADVTTNFGRGGKTAKMLNRTVMPFLNPSIQGWSKLVRTVFGKKNVSQWIQLIVRSLLLGIGLTALNDLLNGDDEDYKAVSLRDKENYYLFNIGDGQFLKLPKGRVLSVFGSLYLRGKESAKGNANAWDGYLESAASAVSPVDNFTRTIFSPLTDAATNTTWYGGVIEGRGLQNLSPENRYDESTSEIAKALGKALNYSPKKIHYIIDQYSGVIGDIVLPMTTAKSERGLIASNFTVNTAVSNRYSGEFYDKLDEITYAKNDGDRNAAFKYRYLNDIAGEVSDMYAKRREIENSDLSQQDKSAQSEAVSVLISQTQKSAVKGLDVLDEILNSIDYDKRVAKLTQGFAYRQLTDDEKEKAAVKMYDYYYALAMNKAFGAELDRKQTICNMINDDRIFIYLAHISSLTADTDSNGNTINGSRKKKVETYVDGLPLSSLHKYLLMLLAGYKLGDIGKNKVAGYFNEAALDNSIRENLLSFVA